MSSDKLCRGPLRGQSAISSFLHLVKDDDALAAEILSRDAAAGSCRVGTTLGGSLCSNALFARVCAATCAAPCPGDDARLAVEAPSDLRKFVKTAFGFFRISQKINLGILRTMRRVTMTNNIKRNVHNIQAKFDGEFPKLQRNICDDFAEQPS